MILHGPTNTERGRYGQEATGEEGHDDRGRAGDQAGKTRPHAGRPQAATARRGRRGSQHGGVRQDRPGRAPEGRGEAAWGQALMTDGTLTDRAESRLVRFLPIGDIRPSPENEKLYRP